MIFSETRGDKSIGDTGLGIAVGRGTNSHTRQTRQRRGTTEGLDKWWQSEGTDTTKWDAPEREEAPKPRGALGLLWSHKGRQVSCCIAFDTLRCSVVGTAGKRGAGVADER